MSTNNSSGPTGPQGPMGPPGPPGPPGQVIYTNGSYSIPNGILITQIPLPFVYTIPSSNLPDLSEQIVGIKKKISDGCTCKKCREFFPYAEPNQKDGSMVCYGCRMTW